MKTQTEPAPTLADVLTAVADAGLSDTQLRDMTSAVKRVSEMLGAVPSQVVAEPASLRAGLRKLRPAAFDITAKTLANMKSLLAAALQRAGIVDDMGRGSARRHPAWAPLMQAIAVDKRLATGLAAFANWCAVREIAPDKVTDETVQRFLAWLETRTLHPKPRDLACAVPRLWNDAATHFQIWPQIKLTRLSFRPPRQRLAWEQLSESLHRDAEAYLARRAEPDVFDESASAPRRPLAPSTLRQHREHLRLAASVLVENGMDVAAITSLADLVQPERFKTVLRHYNAKADGRPSAFAIAISSTLIDAARYHVGVSPEQFAELKRLAAKLPPVPFELTEKNKQLLRQLESGRLRAKLLFLAEDMLAEVAKAIEAGALPFVAAQVAIAIDIQLAVPLRPQNLTDLAWRRHFLEPDGPRGRVLLHIPAGETKTRQRDLTVELPDEVAQRLRWYRRQVLPRLNADPNGPLFVTGSGRPKTQETLSLQITETLAERVGIHMTPHQFRHFAAVSYLEANPEDFHTVQALLGHSWAKTTQIYAGSSSRRASRAYGRHLLEQREELKLKRTRPRRRRMLSAKCGNR